ncbi:hypothetical protein L1785_13520 [Antribacter sp. KLBMP9083]|uniref:Uncharacterized protein n=1 Tax=Antribacter soli TaxID=2910976 RepID=A0AA41QEK0_9MICO|nr:hypothetical protein [Antribacter soli]MCF4121998.1 hypothetical protein [Antribacter soli]
MTDKFNWFVIPKDPQAITELLPGATDYDLLNEYTLQRLIYRRREYGINLDWAELDPGSPSPSFYVARGFAGAGPINYNEPVAIGIRDGGYLRYGSQEYGINLRWSGSPVYEWRLVSEDINLLGTPVRLGQPVGLRNDVVPDELFYDPRRYGINLKWLQDKGKFNSRPWYAPITTAIGGVISELRNLASEGLWRLIHSPDFLLTIIGIRFPKQVRVHFMILRDTSGKPVFLDQNSPAFGDDKDQLDKAIAAMRRCLNEVNVEAIIEEDKNLYRILPFPAPAYALDVKCKGGAWGEDLKLTGRYFRGNRGVSGISVFVVREVEGKSGCSLGPLADYVTVGADKGFENSTSGPPYADEQRPTTPVHEIGHACMLQHRRVTSSDQEERDRERKNLMKARTPRGVTLSRVQAAILRTSRHMRYRFGTGGTIVD